MQNPMKPARKADWKTNPGETVKPLEKPILKKNIRVNPARKPTADRTSLFPPRGALRWAIFDTAVVSSLDKRKRVGRGLEKDGAVGWFLWRFLNVFLM